jgi:hypothetical protein
MGVARGKAGMLAQNAQILQSLKLKFPRVSTDSSDSNQGELPMKPLELRVVVFRGNTKWVAQCLERDIAAQADSLAELPTRLGRALTAEIAFSQERGEPAFEMLPEAPRRYWAMWHGAEEVTDPEPWSGVPVEILPKLADNPSACR